MMICTNQPMGFRWMSTEHHRIYLIKLNQWISCSEVYGKKEDEKWPRQQRRSEERGRIYSWFIFVVISLALYCPFPKQSAADASVMPCLHLESFWWQSTYHLIWDEYVSQMRESVRNTLAVWKQKRNRWAVSVKILSQLCWFRQVYTLIHLMSTNGKNKMKRIESSVAMKMMIIQNVSISKSLIFLCLNRRSQCAALRCQ